MNKKKKKQKLLLIGPLPPPITGISLANKIVKNSFPKFYEDINIIFINTSNPVFKEKVGKFSFKKIFLYMKQYREIYKIFKVDKVYITPGQTFWGVLKYSPYFFVAKFFQKEIIIHSHGNYLHQEYKNLKGIKKKILKKILSLADKGIVLSPSLRKNLEPFLPNEKIFEVYNFVEDYIYEKSNLKEFKELKIIYLSNLMEEKGILDLFESLKILKESHIEFSAKIAGHVDNWLERKVKKYLNDLAPEVKFLGVVDGKKKKKLLDWGNIFVFPTYYHREAQPISILESMATGNIILTTKHGGIPDIFKEGINGFYIEKKNPKSIVEKLMFIQKNPELCKKISQNNILEAKSKYREEIFIKNLKKVFDS